MKILFLSASYYPNIGGVEKHVLKVSEELINRGNEVSILTELSPNLKPNKKNNYQSIEQSDTYGINLEKPVKSRYFEHFEYKKTKIYYFKFGRKGWFKKFRIWWILLKNKNIIQHSDIVHCHDVFFWYLPFRFLYPHKKIFTTFHGYESYPIKSKAIIIRKISEIFSNGTICVGEFMKKWYFANPDYIIYGGVNIPKTIKPIKTASALFFGRLDEQTSILDYCKAVVQIRKLHPKFDFAVAGEGKFYSKAKETGRMLGFVKNPENLLTKYRFAFVSRYLSILEALAAKRMVLALYDNPVKRDYLEMAPFKKYINIVNDYRDLASKVQLYYSNKKNAQSKLDKGHSWASKQTWGKVTDTYLKLWEI
ncbi:MAG: hypothetical protein A3C27_03780 [Candidatus Levybacteria bacterium RIFCSPHIGHO2_02_FULL_39_36]|nr:MAG: Glycosyltransferase, group 1 family protein [Candidatus Levybacteria bacterium GW2011_GWA1_39_11]KKR24589.1 MAG: Glycosyltransferase, group 1 family protein [Candidatus Levybacteria bacterium GW2011_GWB1_39_7]KKR27447.1 MAG: glycosyl transferase, group 1 family protein [Microgenomates group bacterium GW2011_GWC1_39_7]OGH25997.1 MAG: hypothetical protein A3E68_03095 [Candidatus Levybacteria bacterium RIFCSPHIGHO2_12_FULL_39_39]OGH28839.1 MAG: hypothetical protein A3C27_03780 [Candidatus 